MHHLSTSRQHVFFVRLVTTASHSHPTHADVACVRLGLGFFKTAPKFFIIPAVVETAATSSLLNCLPCKRKAITTLYSNISRSAFENPIIYIKSIIQNQLLSDTMSSIENNRLRVVIVGAGVAGLTLANALEVCSACFL